MNLQPSMPSRPSASKPLSAGDASTARPVERRKRILRSTRDHILPKSYVRTLPPDRRLSIIAVDTVMVYARCNTTWATSPSPIGSGAQGSAPNLGYYLANGLRARSRSPRSAC